MFEPNDTGEWIAIGQADVEARVREIRAFLGEPLQQVASV
jgi:hypothetical protein